MVTPDEADAALAAVERARADVAAEVGLPRGYWWGMGVAWALFGLLAEVGDPWVTTAVTLVFGAAHSVVASRLLDGRSRTRRVRVSAAAAGRRTAPVVVAVLLALVALTVAAALALDADGAGRPALAAGVAVGVLIGGGGPEILRGARRLLHA
ncbi:MAG: hypothetical protein FWE71_06865 [Nocardioidaceae bacterium]|nr:hypothetical protein [Nocardioidaceae bacterium]MCL2613483.1 hypothetical protein [Nocardioidaceae bacterium]